MNTNELTEQLLSIITPIMYLWENIAEILLWENTFKTISFLLLITISYFSRGYWLLVTFALLFLFKNGISKTINAAI